MKKKNFDENFDEIISQYHADLKLTQNVKKSFNEMFCEIVGDSTPFEFWVATDLSKQTMRNMKKVTDNEHKIGMRTLISFAVGYNVPLNVVKDMLSSIGCSFNYANSVHLAYVTVLSMYRGREIDEVNVLLKRMGLKEKDLLGSKSRH